MAKADADNGANQDADAGSDQIAQSDLLIDWASTSNSPRYPLLSPPLRPSDGGGWRGIGTPNLSYMDGHRKRDMNLAWHRGTINNYVPLIMSVHISVA